MERNEQQFEDKRLANDGIAIAWHREIVGGMWDEIGQLQFDFLLTQGLNRSDYLLDVGCGSLRAGVHFIKYLDAGHYYGVDKDQQLLEAGQNIELARYNLTEKNPLLFHIEDFNFTPLNMKFNYAIAQSVFTHLYLNSIIMCIMNVEKVLVPGGKFFATFYENPEGKFNLEPICREKADGYVYTYFDKDIFHYDFHTFEFICEGTSLEVEYIGHWNHPRNQRMLVFTKR